MPAIFFEVDEDSRNHSLCPECHGQNSLDLGNFYLNIFIANQHRFLISDLCIEKK